MRFHCTSCHKCPILRQWHRHTPELCCYSPTATARHYNLHLVLDSDKPMPLAYQTARSSCTRWSEDDRNTGTQRVYIRMLCLWLCWRCFLWWCAVYINAVRCTTPRCTPHRNTHNYCEACQYTAVQCEMAILSYNQACCNRKWTVLNMGACNNEAPLHWNYGLATKLQ